MWLIRELARRPSPERPDFEELVAGGEVLSNAVNRVDWSDPEVLLSRCTYCGGDDSDGWVSLRRSGELVVLQPVFDGPTWMAPPSAFARMGIAVVPYALLRAFVKMVPPRRSGAVLRARARCGRAIGPPSCSSWCRAITCRSGRFEAQSRRASPEHEIASCGASRLQDPKCCDSWSPAARQSR